MVAAAAVEVAKQQRAAKREVARLLKEANRAIVPYKRARDAFEKAEMEADRLGKKDRATRDRIYRLKERVYELAAQAEEKLARLDVHKLLVSLRDAYGISLPPGYSVKLDETYLSVMDERELGPLVSTDALASPARLALEFGAAVEVRSQRPFRPGAVGSSLDAVELHDYALKNAERFGLTKDTVKEIERKRRAAYSELPDDYQRRVDVGDYDLKSGEYSELPAE